MNLIIENLNVYYDKQVIKSLDLNVEEGEFCTLIGHSGTGKSTTAKRVADKLGFTYFDTGAMYRSLTYALQRKKITVDDEAQVKKTLENFDFQIKTEGDSKHYFLGQEDISEAIRTPQVTAAVSSVAALPYVREYLVNIQRQFAIKCNAVFEGRDIGTVVFPSAEVKIYLTATPAVRAERRYSELLQKDPEMEKTVEEIQAEIEERDRHDSTRKTSPLKQADDAILVKTSFLSIDEVVEVILEIIHQKTSAHS
jgi:cytidylate kinase